jgi:hypothetical protein
MDCWCSRASGAEAVIHPRGDGSTAPLTSSFKAMEEHITQLGVEDLKLYKAMRRWYNEIADMLGHVNGVLSPAIMGPPTVAHKGSYVLQ